jgi:hypothetical protein
MSLVCAQCSRVNPVEAAYCYYDGAALAGRAGGPINAGSVPFPNQFVFPDGMACRNFDQLAMACQSNWQSAISLLKQGFLGSFFGGMGRVDLAKAAQEAAKFPDIDRGLDQLLAKLPTQALQGPKLQAEPSEINIGQIKVNEDRSTELHLTNLGMRLLYGTVTSDCKWLTLGDAPGHPEKMFQFGSESIVPVQVRGQRLRAGNKPLEGHLVIDSNGGTITVTLKADVPITPYPDGLFAGADTPRQICAQAKAHPKQAAPAFEHGAIARWYAANGWMYPVQGPIMPGVGAIQQFFEALGVAKGPKVDFHPKQLDLQGAVGKTIEASIEVTTTEKKPVYGWATCDQPWVEIGQTKLAGRNATIPLTIRIPSPSPPTLEATLNLVGNGNQKATVSVKVQVAGGKAGVRLQPEEEFTPLEIIEDEGPMVMEIIEEPAPVLAASVPPPHAPSPFAFAQAPAPTPKAASTPTIATELAQDDSPFAITESPPTPKSKSSASPAPTSSASIAKPSPGLPLPVRLVLHLIPVGILFVCMLVLLVCDIFLERPLKGGGADADEVDPHPYVKIVFDEGKPGDTVTDTMNFAVHKIDPDNKGAPSIKLNWYDNGFGNSIVAKIDGTDAAFGVDGKWPLGSQTGKKAGKYGDGKSRTFEFDKGVYITQTVTVEPGEPVEVKPGEYKRLLDTCLVRYKIHNKDGNKRTHSVGLRVLMDTCIGDKDDVPFTLPGVKEVVTKAQEFKGQDVPDFVQVLQNPSLRDPGIILQLTLRLGDKDKLEPPSRFQLTRYPVSNSAAMESKKKILNKWEVPLFDMGDDSAVVMYWNPKDLPYNKTRELAFTYGLGSVSASDQLGVTIGGATYKGGEFTVLALVKDRDAKTATLDLPKGLELIDPNMKSQPIAPMRPGADGQLRPSPVTWRVRAASEGKHNIVVTTDNGLTHTRRVTITLKSLFN